MIPIPTNRIPETSKTELTNYTLTIPLYCFLNIRRIRSDVPWKISSAVIIKHQPPIISQRQSSKHRILTPQKKEATYDAHSHKQNSETSKNTSHQLHINDSSLLFSKHPSYKSRCSMENKLSCHHKTSNSYHISAPILKT